MAGAPAGGRPRACRHGHRDAVARTAPAAVCAADGPAIPDRSRRIAGARPHVHGASRRADRALVATVAERTAFGGARGADRAVRTGRGTPVDQLPRTAGHRRRVRDARRLSECAAGHGGRTERAAGRPAEAEKAPRLHPPHRDLRAPRARRPAGDRRVAAHDGGDGTARPGPDRVDPGAERRRMAREGAVQAPRGGAEPRAAPASRHARPLDGRGRGAARGPRHTAPAAVLLRPAGGRSRPSCLRADRLRAARRGQREPPDRARHGCASRPARPLRDGASSAARATRCRRFTRGVFALDRAGGALASALDRLHDSSLCARRASARARAALDPAPPQRARHAARRVRAGLDPPRAAQAEHRRARSRRAGQVQLPGGDRRRGSPPGALRGDRARPEGRRRRGGA